MKPEIYVCDYWLATTTWGETYVVPCDVEPNASNVAAYRPESCFAAIISVEKRKGWIGRMSMPGYLDSTEWVAGDSHRAVLNLLKEHYS